MEYGMVIIGFMALVATIGVFGDTKNRGGLKWFLMFLVVLGAVAGGVKVYLDNEEAQKDKQKLEDAVTLAKSSNKLAEDEINKHATDVQGFASEREQMASEMNQMRSGAIMLIGQISTMAGEFDKMEKALAKTKTPEIAEIGLKARIEASKNVVSIAKDAQWMDPPDIAKLEAWFKEDLPLKSQHYASIQAALKNKTLAREE